MCCVSSLAGIEPRDLMADDSIKSVMFRSYSMAASGVVVMSHVYRPTGGQLL